MRLIAIEYPECRLNFFKEQLAAAHRRMDWSMKHNPNWNDHAEKGEVVSFYEWAVQMAEGNHEAVVRCKDCRHNVANWNHDELDGTDYADITCDYFMTDGMKPDDFCSCGERKDGDG